MKKILVTGGAGFIGSYLCERLIEHGEEVFCIDNLSSGSQNNIKQLYKYETFHFVDLDVTKSYDFKVDEIYNLACPASPRWYQEDPIATVKTNFLGTLHALENAIKYDAKILLASTSEIYGDPIEHPQNENYWGNVNPLGVRACYDEGKRVAETLMMDFYRTKKAKIKIIRIFNTYGPRMRIDDGRVITNFVLNALNRKDITIYGTGMQSRSFCYIDDLINGIIKMMGTSDDIIGPVNLGRSEEITIKKLANLIIDMCDSTSMLVYEQTPEDDPTKRKPDLTKANKLLNWKPEIELIEGLQKTIDYYKLV